MPAPEMSDPTVQLRLLCHPSAEGMGDRERIDQFIRLGHAAANEIDRLRFQLVDLELRLTGYRRQEQFRDSGRASHVNY